MNRMGPASTILALVILLAVLPDGTRATSADEGLTLAPGDTVTLRMSAGEPKDTKVAVSISTKTPQDVTIDVSSLEADTRVDVLEPDSSGSVSKIAQDDNGGVATNSRVTLRLEPGVIYQVEIHSTRRLPCEGSVRVAVIQEAALIEPGDR